MSETRGLRSPYGGNREVARLGRVERPDIAITYPNFPTSSSYDPRFAPAGRTPLPDSA